MTEDTIILEVNKLTKHFPIYRGFLRKVVGSVQALNDVSFSVKKQETLGIVGESGCGKTTLARVMLRAYEPTSGEVLFNQDGEMINVFSLKKAELKRLRRNIQIIFQDPLSSLNPRKTVLEIIGEPLLIHGVAHGQELKSRVCELLKMVGLSVNHLDRYPNAFSGGQRQRIAIARALALQPQVVLCDEPVSALDVSIQAQIINLLQDLQKDLGLTYLFISHDLSVVEHISDRVAVMYLGSIVNWPHRRRSTKGPGTLIRKLCFRPRQRLTLLPVKNALFSLENSRIHRIHPRDASSIRAAPMPKMSARRQCLLGKRSHPGTGPRVIGPKN